MAKKSNPNEKAFPRFYAKHLPRSLGLTFIFAAAVLLFITVWAMTLDDKIWLIVVSAILCVALVFMLVEGILSVMAAYEKVHISAAGIRVTFCGLTIYNLPANRIRSAVARAREYKRGWKDKDIYMFQIYWNGRHPQDFALWVQWSTPTEDALREYLPNVDILM